MENPKYILVMRQVASDYDGISHELFQIANNLERMDQFNPQQKLFSLVRNAEVSTVSLRNLTARTVRDDTAIFPVTRSTSRQITIISVVFIAYPPFLFLLLQRRGLPV